jgi:hypothetical protein
MPSNRLIPNSVGAKLNFPGYQEIFDFLSVGGETSVPCFVDSDTDKDFIIYTRNTNSSYTILLRLNSDAGANYGQQQGYDYQGTIYAGRNTNLTALNINASYPSASIGSLIAPVGGTKKLICQDLLYVSGTTIDLTRKVVGVWNNTASINLFTFLMSTGNFTAGTRITVFARRSQS